MVKRMSGLQKAIKKVGSQRKLALGLGITPQSLTKWHTIPSRHIINIERLTGIPREELRPDLYRKEKA